MPETTSGTSMQLEQYIQDILATIDREREREIVARRFGLFDRKETLEQIGELLGITRERVRQLEKGIVARLKSQASNGQLPHIALFQDAVEIELTKQGNIARVPALTTAITGETNKLDQARVAFLAELSPNLVVIDDNDHFHHAVGIAKHHDHQTIKQLVDNIIATIKAHGEPADITTVATKIAHDNPDHVHALATTSKHLATLNGRWGLMKWPMVNPKNIRDKIYVILKEHGKHMHFNEIADAIKESDFKRKDVTTQAIHNELIKDKRFVLIGRGIYALKEWGYSKGTVADIIADVLKKAEEPLHRDEIVKRVLESRYVKETTILLNLQGKPQFKRVAKATYSLAEAE